MLRRLVFVGVAGFEPATSCSQSRRDNRATLHPEKGGKNNQKCMRNMANVNGQRKPGYSVYSAQHSMASTRVAQVTLFLLPSKLGQGIARSADRASRGWTQSTGPGSTRVAQVPLFLLPSKLGQENKKP